MKKIKIKNKKMNMKKRKQCKALFPKTRTLVHQISEEFYYVDLNENPNCLNQHALGKGSSDYPNDFFCENIFACSTVILERIFAIYQHAEATNFYHISRVTESSATLLLFVQCSRRKLLVCYTLLPMVSFKSRKLTLYMCFSGVLVNLFQDSAFLGLKVGE